MSRVVNVSDSITIYPSSFDSTNSTYSSVYSSLQPDNGLSAHDSSTRACVYSNTGNNAVSDLWYNFDCSQIPNNATINSVSCQAGAACYNRGSYFAIKTLQLYVGTSIAKGTAVTVTGNGGTRANHVLDCGSNWTRSDLDNLKIRMHIQRSTSNSTSSASFSFWGATVVINYSINGTAYTIAATSTATGSTVDPATQEVMEGETAVVRLDIPILGNVNVTDNNTDISSLLEIHEVETSGTIEATPQSYTTSGSISGTRYQSTIGHGVDNPSSQTGNDYASNSGSTATIYYKFDFSDIPDNATITSMTVQAYGHLESTSSGSERADLNVYSGTTAKGTTTSFTSTSNRTLTIPAGNWTVAELKDDPRVGFTIGYYGGLVTGITWTAEYTVPSTGLDYYYTYTLTNVSTDHAILVEEKGAYIPPEEDPEYTYWPITISSINATTNPGTGTTRVVEGTTQVVTISPEDPRLALAMDNGVDITSQLVGGTPTNTYTVTERVSGASYGFELNNSTGYYTSSNYGQSKSASVARLNMNFESSCLVTIQYINYAEASYDYGMFGKLDTEVATDGLTASSGSSRPSDSTSNYQISMCSNSQQTQTVTYDVPAGEHFIDIKYGKDDASDSGNDNLQWKVISVTATSAGGDYTYTLTNVVEKHSLIFVFGEVEYYFVTSTGNSACRLFPDGQQVKLPGDGYRLNIVPNNISAGVTITDNNVDVTTLLQREEGVDKYNNTVVSYSYVLTDIQATHNLIVQVGEVITTLYCKINNTWRPVTKAYRKVNGSWVEISDLTTVFSKTKNYRKG